MPVQVEKMEKIEPFHRLLCTEGGEFDKIYKSVRSQVSDEKIKLLEGKSSAERKQFLQTLPQAKFQDTTTPATKELEKALEFKELGNEQFRLNKFGEAYSLYTKALQYCPVDEANPMNPNNKQYSIFLANRSAALDGAGLYAACIKDIDSALKFGYPRELWYKIYKRKGHALIKMKQYLAAREALEISLKNVGRSDIKKEKDRDNYRMRVRKQMSVFNVTKTLYNVDIYPRHPSILTEGEANDRGISKRLRVEPDVGGEGGGRLVAGKDVECEDVLVSVDPSVAVVNVSGGRAGGKICPHKMEKMFRPIPCKFGVDEVFGSEEAREEANSTYHQYEWKILPNLKSLGLIEGARLALRTITCIPPSEIGRVVEAVDAGAEVDEEDPLAPLINTLKLPANNTRPDELLVSWLLSLYLTSNLALSDYIRADEEGVHDNVFHLLSRAVLVALRHTRPIEIMEVPKSKTGILDTDIGVSVCGYGIYPDLHSLERIATGKKSDVIRWFVDKKMVLSSYKKIEAGGEVILFSQSTSPQKQESTTTPPSPTNMITFRCANELCQNSFPLKENTKEKIISCPLEECGLKTNIWERLKLIQRLKKDFASAKEEFSRDEVELARDIIRDTIQEWDRIIVRPYREVTQLENLYIKALQCVIGDAERLMVEGNQMGNIINNKRNNVMPPAPAEGEEGQEQTTTKIVKI